MVYFRHVLLSTQVTAVKVKEDTVFIGEGQYLHIHSLTSGERLTSIRVFQAAAIHGIQISVHLGSCSDVWKTLVWGQKSLSVVCFKPSEKICWLLVEERGFEDWIVDAAWEGDLTHVVVATAHNSLLRFEIPSECVDNLIGPTQHINDCIRPARDTAISTNQQRLEKCKLKAKEQCVENCIVYCGCIVIGSGSWEKVVLLAGTVFSQVLIWGPWGQKNHGGRIHPSHCLSGHQGVLFSINFCAAKNVITTTSDDRSLRVWGIHKHQHCESEGDIHKCVDGVQTDVDNQENYWKYCHIVEKYKCYGHGSRVWQSLILPSCFVSVGEDSKVCVWDENGILVTSWKAHDGSCVWCVAASESADKIVTGGGDGSVKSWCLKLDVLEKVEPICDLPWNNDNTRTVYDDNEDHCVNDSIPDKKIAENKRDTEHNVKYESNSLSENDSTMHSDAGLFGNQEKTTCKSKRENNSILSKIEDFPRCVSLLGLDRYLVMMDSGKLYIWDFKVSAWSLVYEDKRMRNYAVMESSTSQDLVAVGTLCGHIVILGIDVTSRCMKVIAEEKVVTGKVFSALWLSRQKILTCGSEGIMISWNVNLLEGKMQKEETYVLPTCKQRWVSAACLYAPSGMSHLICGDRAGGIHLYLQNLCKAQHSLRGIHGRNGVTSLTNYRGYMYSTGRDGCVRCLTVQEDCLQVITVTRVCNVNWVASLINLYGRLLAVCFHDIKLKLWSLEEDRAVVEVECGGGHRSWALQASEEENELIFIYIKDTKPYTFRTTLKDKLMPLIKTPLNTRETMCLQVLFQVNDITIFTTGGEDTTVRLHTVVEGKLNTISVIRSHISNIRAMCRIDHIGGKAINGNITWIISAGGRAQLKVWKATHNIVSAPGGDKVQPLDISCREVTSHMLRTGSSKTWKSQEMTLDPETRFMDVTAFWVSETQALIILASSDGFVRFYEFDSQHEKIKLFYSQVWKHCLLKVERIHLCHQCILVSAATDGFLVFWNIQPLVDWIRHDEGDSQRALSLDQLACIKAHQSGINSIAISMRTETKCDDSCSFIMASGGDDNKISIWEVTVDVSEMGKPTVSVTHICDAYGHASQVTGLNWLTADHLVSTSIDQRVIVWRIQQRDKNTQAELTSVQRCHPDTTDTSENINKLDKKAVKEPTANLESVSSHFTGVPDVKGLTVVNNTHGHSETSGLHSVNESSECIKRILIYGVGLQVYDVKVNGT